MKKLLLVIMFLIPCSICSFWFKRKATFFIDKNTSKNTKIVYLKDRNLYLDINDYVFGVVAAEMPALFNDEALKAQAVAARSYLLSSKDNDNLYSTNLNAQAYLDIYELKKRWGDDFNKYYEKVINAVKDTGNEVIYKNDSIMKTFYFAMSNGYTENSVEVFGTNDIESVPSLLEVNLNNYEVSKKYKLSDILSKLGVSSLDGFDIKRNDTNHVREMCVKDKCFSGVEVRKLLNLRSTDFEIKINGDDVSITTKGYGHGVGMSQNGANLLAKDGYSYKEILKYYYKDIIIKDF